MVGGTRAGKAGLFRRRGIGTRSALFIARAGQVVGVGGVPEQEMKNTGWSETTGQNPTTHNTYQAMHRNF